MEKYYQTRKDNSVYNQEIKRYDSNGMASKQMDPKTKFNPSMLYQGWGYSTYQQPTENNYKTFGAQNMNINRSDQPSDMKDVEFERWLPLTTEYDFTQRWNKSPSMYSNINFGEEEKTHNISVHNSFLLDENSIKGEYQLSEAKNWFPKTNQLSNLKPSKFSLDNNLISLENPIKSTGCVMTYTTQVKMKSLERDEWKANLVIKIQQRTDPNLHYSYWTIQLTDETNPLFLYTWDIGETEFHAIRQDQKVRVEFHKLAEYLGELFELCARSSSGSSSSSFHTCILSTDRSNIGILTIEESTRFKDISLINLKFLSSWGEDKLKFLSKQIIDLKNLVASQRDEINSKSTKIDELSQNYQQLEKVSTKSNNEGESMRMVITQLQQTVEELSMRNDSNYKEAQDFKSELEITTKRKNDLEENKIRIEGENREIHKKIEHLERDNAAYKKENDTLISEIKELRETRFCNSKDLTEFKFKNEHLSSELKTLTESNEAKQRLIENQNSKIKQLEDELKIVKNNFAKQNSKLKQCAAEINKGNEIIYKHRKEIKELK